MVVIDDGIFVGSLDNGVWKSTDHGDSWVNTFGTGYGTGSRRMITAGDTAVMSYAGFLRGIYKWNISNQTWEQKFTLPNDFYDFVKLPNNDILATANVPHHIGGIYKSTDNGENWSSILQTENYDNPSLIDSYNGVIYYFNGNNEFWESDDFGLNWSLVTTLSQVSTASKNDMIITPDSKIYVSFIHDNGILYSEDLGLTWNFLNTGLPDLNVVDFTYYNDKLYVATYGGLCVLEDLPIIANFSADVTSGQAPLEVNFTDSSTPADSIFSWEWDFQNDGIIDSYVQNPTYTYQDTGSYSVSLNVTDINDSTDIEIKVNYVQVYNSNVVSDIDGNVYQTVQIGDRLWMAENLKVTHYRNGDPIPKVTNDSQWTGLSSGAYCYYDNDPDNADIYGALYNWFAVDDSRSIAPEGWHVPTDEEIKQLEMELGMSQSQANSRGFRGTNEGSKLAGGYNLWQDDVLRNNPEFDTSGFSFFPGGYRSNDGPFNDMSISGNLWSSTANTPSCAWNRILFYNTTTVNRNYQFNYVYTKKNGLSIRCVRDAPVIPFSANFTADTTSGYVPLTVNFTDQSIPPDSIVYWQWDFQNDGIIDFYEQNPSYTYTTEDSFSVKLIVETTTEADTLIKENYISATYGPPQNLTATASTGDITLAWNQSYDPDILLYKIYRDTIANPTTQINSIIHPDTTYLDTNVADNTTYYYRLKGYNYTGEETDFSNEVSAQLAPQMSVDVSSFDYTVNTSSENTIVDSFVIDNSGGGQLNYSIAGSDTLEIMDFGTCLEFDGVNDYADIGIDDILNPSSEISISAWVYVTGNTNQNRMFVAKGDDYEQYAFSVSTSNKFRPHIRANGWHYYDGNTTILENTWYHVVETYNGVDMKLYVDGVIDGTWNINNPISYSATDGNLFIGNMRGKNYYFKGEIDDVSIYDIALTQSQVTSLYNDTLPTTISGLIGYWNFDEGTGAIAHDSTINGNDGTLTNMNLTTCWVESTIPTIPGSILSFDPSSGILDGGSRLNQNVIMTVDVEDIVDGIYNTSADITHNDPNVINPFIIPVTITVDRAVPDQVTGLYSTVTMTDITLHWDANTAVDLFKYNIYRNTDPEEPTLIDTVDSITTTYIDDNIPNEEDSYYYWVSAADENGNEGTLSDSILSYLDIPDQVQNFSIDLVGSDAVLSWDDVTQTVYGNPIQDLTGYIIYFTEKIYNADTLFSYHAFTTDTTYTHQYAATFADVMFYRVTAYVGDLDLLDLVIARQPNFKLGELEKYIDEERENGKLRGKGER